MTALFAIAVTWKQPRWPLTDECIEKLWYLYIVDYYSAVRTDAFESFLF